MVTLLEVIEAGGYDLTTVEDARWLLSKQYEFERLVDEAAALVDEADAEADLLAELEYKRSFPEEE